MEIRVLRYFLQVAREENMTKAAGQLHITQPTLSRQLAALEDELGVRLFLRGAGHLRLTPEGVWLRRRAQEIVELCEKTQEELQLESRAIGGTVSIGSGETEAFQWLLQGLETFTKQYPSVQLDLQTGNAEQIREKVDRGLLDLAVLMEPVDVTPFSFVDIPVFETWGVLMRRDDPLAKEAAITPEKLRQTPGHSLILQKRETLQGFFEKWYGPIDPGQVVAWHDMLANAAHLVHRGLGRVVTIEAAAKQFMDDTLCFRPLSPALHTKSMLVWKKGQPMSRACEKLLEILFKQKEETEKNF